MVHCAFRLTTVIIFCVYMLNIFFLLRKNWKLGGKSGVAGEELEGREWG